MQGAQVAAAFDPTRGEGRGAGIPGGAARRGEESVARGIPAASRAQVSRGVARAVDDFAGAWEGGGTEREEKGISCC